ncbi:MAG: tRNA preQ1(34) S-adenosylmethionine ribosyltransferase-isomerase QueA [Peptoniphilaceae bacterium]
MKTSDFYYDLPKELIAQSPLENRSSSKFLLVNKKDGSLEHRHFYDIVDLLNKGDVLVFNDTRVIPARIYGHRKDKEEKIEFLLLNEVEKDKWECLSKPGKKAKIGTEIIFSNELRAEVVDISDEGNRFIKFKYEGIFQEILDRLGEMPLPPYITESLDDKERYQTIYSRERGSAAAPTAGLHFTEDILKRLKEKGVELVFVTLHVGLGTFRPVKVEDVAEHHMHSEFYRINEEAAKTINKAKKENRRIIGVGTTSVRTIESASDKNGLVKASSGWTDIFIYPGYKFKTIDSLITNFHLPESTLLMLVSAISSKEIILNAYKEAIKENYRFFSFGDAMFIY